MNTEEDEFNRIERESKMRKQAVESALDKMAENARELGLDYEPAHRQIQSLKALVRAQQITIDKLDAAQQAPVQEPVAYCDLENWLTGKVWADDVFSNIQHKGWSPLYTTPPAAQRQWVGLTDEDKLTVRRIPWETLGDLMDNIEAKLKEKNNG